MKRHRQCDQHSRRRPVLARKAAASRLTGHITLRLHIVSLAVACTQGAGVFTLLDNAAKGDADEDSSELLAKMSY